MVRSIFIFIFLLTSFATSISAKNYGLIIAVGDYPEEGHWVDISSKNDIEHVYAALLQLGFSKNDITSLVDAAATKKGIVASIKNLIAVVKKGDIVYIHFSGHGQQVLDDNNDELDNLDEAIVPYDSPMIFEKGKYEGERLIRDDLLGELTQEIRKKCGKTGQVILVLDSCHSGTGTRGMGKVRGTQQLMAPSDFVVANVATEKSTKIVKGYDDNWAPMASFFGASPRELNYETLDDQSRPVGSLSYALSSVLVKMKKSYNFEELFERVKLKMKVLAPRQNPQWEGPKDVLILGGTLPKDLSSYLVTERPTSNTIKASLGTLSDVFAGSTVEVYSKDQGKVLCRGEVTSAMLTQSVIQLDSDLEMHPDELLEVRIIEKAFSPISIQVDMRLDDSEYWSPLGKSIVESQHISLDKSNADLFIFEKEGSRELQVATRDGSVLYTSEYREENLENVEEAVHNVIRSYMQGVFLKSYENPISNFDFSIELVVVDCTSRLPIQTFESQDVAIKVGACVQFKVKNNGVSGAYFSLIDIQPDNVINLITPAIELGYTADEYYLKGGESYATNYPIEIAQPLGQETIKLITSKAPLDLTGIIASEGKATRGLNNLDPFEELFSSTYDVGTRGTVIKRKPGEEVGATTLFFKIQE